MCVRAYLCVCVCARAPAPILPSTRSFIIRDRERNSYPRPLLFPRCFFRSRIEDRLSPYIFLLIDLLRQRYQRHRPSPLFPSPIGWNFYWNEARIVSRFSFSPHDHLRQKGEKIAEHEDTNNIYEATGCYVERVLIKLVSRARNNRT